MVAWSALAVALFVPLAAAQSAVAGVRIDDSKVYSDATRDGIQLSPGWTGDDSDGKHYKGTYTSTQTTGSYMMLSFRGTSIAYYADKAPDSGVAILALDGRPFNATWRDQNVVTTVQRQQQMWIAVGLPEGDHQLVLGTSPSYTDSTGTVGLDYFSITPVSGSESVTPLDLGPGASIIPSGAVIVDNEDPAIRYSDVSWRIFGLATNGPIPLYFNGTQRSSIVPGSSATFTFHGTDVWYFCDEYWGNTKVSISVDGGEGEIVDTRTPGITWVTQKAWWSKRGLSPGKHTVKVTHVGQNNEYANVDFFMYTPSDPSLEPATGGLSKAMIGTIVGAVVGGLVVLLGLVMFGVFLFRRKRAAKETTEVEKKDMEGAHVVQLPKRGSEDTLATVDEKTEEKTVV